MPEPSRPSSDGAAPRVVRRPARPPRRSAARTALLGVAVAVVGVAVIAGAGALWGWWSFQRIDRIALELTRREPTEPQNFLVVGSDSRDSIDENHPGAGGMLGPSAPAGQRADSIMVARVDPDSDRVDLLSVPRDLWVPIAGTDEEQRINTAYAQSAQAVVDTVQNELGIPIHHFVEVDFAGFSDLVDSLGGVPMYFDSPVRDTMSGLFVDEPGCRVLNGYEGLAFARARSLQWNDGSRWHSDPTGDLGRMIRQQLLTRAALARAQSLGIGDLGRLRSLVDAGVGSVRLDDTIGTGDLLDLGSKLSDLDPQRMQTHSLPVTPHRTPGGAEVVLLDELAAEPVLEIFRKGAAHVPVTTTTAPPPLPTHVTVEVHNGSGKEGEARRVSFVMVAYGGFGEGPVESAPDRAVTVVEHAPGGRAMAELAAAWLGPDPELAEVADVEPGNVRIVLGADFERVAEPSDEEASNADGSRGTEDAADGQMDVGEADPSEAATPPTVTTTTTTVPGWTPSQPPEGVSCP